jgi:hypothetical protein
VLNAAVFALVAVMTNVLLTQALDAEAESFPPQSDIDAYNVMFFGSSVSLAIDPAQFDAAMSERGYAVRSVNFGELGAFAHETNYRLRRVLSRQPPDLRFVFIEAVEFDNKGRAVTGGTRRETEWHDLYETLSAIHVTGLSDMHWDDKVKEFRRHVTQCLNRYSVLGRGVRATEEPPQVRRPFRGGRRDIVRAMREAVAESPEFRGDRSRYEALVRGLRMQLSRGPEGAPPFEDQVAAFGRQRAWIAKRGVRPIYLAHPAFHHDPRVIRALEQRGVIADVLYFDDPEEYPELFDIGARADRNHLNVEASRRYTRLLAEVFADRLDENPQWAEALR